MQNQPLTTTPQAGAARRATNTMEDPVIQVPAEESFDTIALQGSMQQILSDNLGQYVICEFLIGTHNMERRGGVLYSVGRSYIVLFDDFRRVYTLCDIFSIKFVTFFLPENRPGAELIQECEGI